MKIIEQQNVVTLAGEQTVVAFHQNNLFLFKKGLTTGQQRYSLW